MKIPDAKKHGLCREYPQVYMIGHGCKKSLILWLTVRRLDSDWRELLQREAIRAGSAAEQARSRSGSGGAERSENTLMARSEPYNPLALLHALPMIDAVETFDQK